MGPAASPINQRVDEHLHPSAGTRAHTRTHATFVEQIDDVTPLSIGFGGKVDLGESECGGEKRRIKTKKKLLPKNNNNKIKINVILMLVLYFPSQPTAVVFPGSASLNCQWR